MPYVASVTNQRASYGGADEETVAQAQVRAPMVLRTSNRAVSGEDFAFLAMQTPGAQIARAQAFPLLNPNFRVTQSTRRRTGATRDPNGRDANGGGGPAKHDDAESDAEAGALQLVAQWLDQFRLLTTELYVAPPQYRQVTIQASIIAQPTADSGIVEAGGRQCIAQLFQSSYRWPKRQWLGFRRHDIFL